MSSKYKDPWVRKIDVSNPVLHSKGYTLYKVTSKVFPKNSVEAVTEVIVWKRYSDFKKLHKSLSAIHQNLYLKGTFPLFAKTRFFGRFDPGVVEERRLSALNLLQFAANSFPLFTSQVFVKFFEEGHIPENINQETINQEPLLDEVLKPLTSSNFKDICDVSGDSSGELGDTLKNSTSLGGTWQHHQGPDNISLSSEITDDDDRTTFTDDESVLSRPSLDLTEFDPLQQPDIVLPELDKYVSNHVNLCNSWLLSALDSCNEPAVDKDHEVLSDYPTPFREFEFPDYSSACKVDLNINDFNSDSNKNYFIFDIPTPKVDDKETNLVPEFDSLINENVSSPNDKIDALVCDEFATTPKSCLSDSAERPSYIILAAKYVHCAQEAEKNESFLEAFDSYKKAIEILLQGIQKDKTSDLKDAIRKKVLLYLMRAEELYENKLPKVVSSHSLKCSSNIKSCMNSVEELNKYKVIGILDKTLLVLDITSNETFVAKTLYKCPSDKATLRNSVMPKTVPFMVKLQCVYETSHAIIFILEHATGGRLFNYVSSFFQRKPFSPIEDGTCLQLESKAEKLCNVYSGKKISEKQDAEILISKNTDDPDLTFTEQCPSSYVALFKKYANSVNKENNIPLAKYCEDVQSESKNIGDSAVLKHSGYGFKEKSLQQSTIPHNNVRNRLSSSTGSLELGFSQKPCVAEVFNAMDVAISHFPSKLLLPESCVSVWAAEIILAFEYLHNLGIIWKDFHPNNILLGDEGHILLTYQSQWNGIDYINNEIAKESFYCAPEVGNIFPVTADCDWWSLGAIIFELLTGQTVASCHPTGITRHTLLNIPTDISLDAKDFIIKLLQFNPTERLGSGIYGVEELKSHKFFHSIDWKTMLQR